jgi:hypothetical protein
MSRSKAELVGNDNFYRDRNDPWNAAVLIYIFLSVNLTSSVHYVARCRFKNSDLKQLCQVKAS